MSSAIEEEKTALRRGWTTGACATAATRAAFCRLLTGEFPDPVTITLPGGEKPAFALAREEVGSNWAMAGIVKDAGDDPDVTHGALIQVRVSRLSEGQGIQFRAGKGVGRVTKDGLPIPPGEPAINPVPRRMMTEVIEELAIQHKSATDLEIEISVPGGEEMALKTWNPRLGIVDGISILGTTGIVRPFSCSAWIHAIHRGIDVARASGLDHVAGATGSTSEAAVQKYYDLPIEALIDMGDFVGGMLKYLRRHPVKHVTVAGGFGKMTKFAQGHLDLHSGRSQVDFQWLADAVQGLEGRNGKIAGEILSANTAAQVLKLCKNENIDIAQKVADAARKTAVKTIGNGDISLDVILFGRTGEFLARSG